MRNVLETEHNVFLLAHDIHKGFLLDISHEIFNVPFNASLVLS